MSTATFDKATSLYVRSLRVVALLPLEGNETCQFLGRGALTIFYLMIVATHTSMALAQVVRGSIQGHVKLDSISEAALVLGTELRYVLLLRRRSELAELVDDCRSIWARCTELEHRTVRLFERKVAGLFKFLFSICAVMNVLYPLAALNVRLPPAEPNGTERRILPYPWFNEDAEKCWPSYEVIYVLEIFLILNASVVAISVDVAAPFLIMINCGYLKVLQDRFLLASGCKSEAEFRRELVTYIKFHQSVLSVCSKIDGLTRTIFLLQLLTTGYNISLAGIKLLGTDPDRYKFVTILGLCVIQLFMCQWAPETLLVESEGVSTAAYFALTVSLNPRVGRLLLLTIARAQKPMQLTAGGIVRLSIENFGSIITGAVSFFTILRGMNA